MDDETNSRFDGIDDKLKAVDGKFDAMMAHMDGRFASLVKLIEDHSQSLQQEVGAQMDSRFASLAKLIEDHSQSLQQEMGADVNRLEAALARNTKVLAGGSKAVAGIIKWSEKRDELDRKRDQEIRDLRTRVQKLERAERASKRRAS